MNIIELTFEEVSDYNFIPPCNFYYRNCVGNYIFISTSDREVAQKYIDEEVGIKGKYTAIPTKISKTKSKLENGGYSACGTATR